MNIFNSLNFEGEEVDADDGAAPSNENKNMVRLSNFDMIKVINRRSFAKVLMIQLKTTRRIYAMEELATDDDYIDWVQTATNPPFRPWFVLTPASRLRADCSLLSTEAATICSTCRGTPGSTVLRSTWR